MGTREAIATLKVIAEKSIEFGNSLYICFVDYEKAFDRIDWVKLMEVLKKIGLDWRERKVVWELYSNQTAVIQVGNDLSEPAYIEGDKARWTTFNNFFQCLCSIYA